MSPPIKTDKGWVDHQAHAEAPGLHRARSPRSSARSSSDCSATCARRRSTPSSPTSRRRAKIDDPRRQPRPRWSSRAGMGRPGAPAGLPGDPHRSARRWGRRPPARPRRARSACNPSAPPPAPTHAVKSSPVRTLARRALTLALASLLLAPGRRARARGREDRRRRRRQHHPRQRGRGEGGAAAGRRQPDHRPGEAGGARGGAAPRGAGAPDRRRADPPAGDRAEAQRCRASRSTPSIEEIKKQNSLDDDQLREALRAQGMTMAAYRADLKTQLLRYRVLNIAVGSRVTISDDEVQVLLRPPHEGRRQRAGAREPHLRRDPRGRRRGDRRREAGAGARSCSTARAAGEDFAKLGARVLRRRGDARRRRRPRLLRQGHAAEGDRGDGLRDEGRRGARPSARRPRLPRHQARRPQDQGPQAARPR